MEVLQNYNRTQFMEYAPKVKKNLGEWYIVEVFLTGQTHHNAPYIALKLRDYFDGKDGAIFICNSRNVLALTHMGQKIDGQALSNDIHEKLPQHSCTAQTTDMTSDGLEKIQFRLEAIEQDNKAQPRTSALLTTRLERQERIIMMIDDDVIMRSLVRKTFETQGKVIRVPGYRQRSWNPYLEHLPDVVFLDIHLPGGSGIKLLEGNSLPLLYTTKPPTSSSLSADSVKAQHSGHKAARGERISRQAFYPRKTGIVLLQMPDGGGMERVINEFIIIYQNDRYRSHSGYIIA